MADTMQFDLVSPERRLVSVQATAVRVPGSEGDLTIMANHAPLITSLRPGVLEVVSSEGTKHYVVTGGFAEISNDGTSVLAEEAFPSEEVTQEVIDAMVAKAHALHKEAHPDMVDSAAKLLADMVAIGGYIGLEPKLPNA